MSHSAVKRTTPSLETYADLLLNRRSLFSFSRAHQCSRLELVPCKLTEEASLLDKGVQQEAADLVLSAAVTDP